MRRIVTVYNKKGGTGKTSISFNLAKDLGCFLLSNDDSVIEEIYPDKAKILDDIMIPDEDVSIVYDLGGFVDSDAIELFKKSDLVVIPTLLDINSIKRTINTVMEINSFSKKIVIVVNRIKKQTFGKYRQSIEALKGLGKELYFLRESEAITNSIHLGKTITELYNENALSRNAYAPILEEYNSLLKTVKG